MENTGPISPDGKETCDQYGTKWRYKKVNHLRNMFMQPVLQLAHDPYCDDNRNYMALISNLSDGKSKQMP